MPDDNDIDPYLDPSDKNNWRAGFVPSVTNQPRRAGKGSANALINEDMRPLQRPIRRERLYPRMTIRFTTHRRFTYVAVFITETERWYVSGSGKWFHTNELTTEQMSEVLMRDTTSQIVVVSSVTPAHTELT